MKDHKITKLAFVMVFVSFLLSTAASLLSLHLMGQRNIREVNTVLAARIYETISSELSEPITVARTMANDRFLMDFLAQEDSYRDEDAVGSMRRYLSDIKEGLDYEVAFVVSEASKRYYTWDGLNKVINPEQDEYDLWYTFFKEQDKAYDLDVNVDEIVNNRWTVFVNARIQNRAGKFLGVCGVGVQMMNLQDFFNEYEQAYNVKISLIDADGLIQVDTDESSIEKAYLKDVKTGGKDSGEYVHQTDGGTFIVSKYVENLDWYLVVRSDGGIVKGQIINVIVLNILLFLLVAGVLLWLVNHVMKRTTALTDASFRDQITRLYNRRAFEEEKERLRADGLENDFVYMTADVNGLKTVNDTLGHEAGDELIQGAAQCLKDCYGRYGRIFRIGGDEFAAMLTLSPERLEEVREAFDRMLAGWSGKQVDRLSISCGFASRREFPSENIAEIIRISDERMYAAKTEYYRTSGQDRRRT